MTITSIPVRSIDHDTELSESSIVSSTRVIDFLTARDRLLTEIDEPARQLEIDKKANKAVALRRHSIQLVDRIEDGLYSLISAAALGALLLLCLSDSTRPGTQQTAAERSRMVVGGSADHGNPFSAAENQTGQPRVPRNNATGGR